MTRLIVLLGDPVAHSLSPRFQNAAFRHAGLDATYIPLRCAAADVPGLLRGIARAGGAGNVTVPHKTLAATCVEKPTDNVDRTGACNCFWLDADDAICGDNTDVAGFRHAAARLMPDLRGRSVILLGAGGAAAAALCALIDDDVGRITILNRSPERARALAAHALDRAEIHIALRPAELPPEPADLIVNATSLGLRDVDPLPLDLRTIPRPHAALDLVYHPSGVTPWVRHARELGIPAEAGLEMLLAQGAAAFAHWFGRPAPIDVMRAALETAPPVRR